MSNAIEEMKDDWLNEGEFIGAIKAYKDFGITIDAAMKIVRPLVMTLVIDKMIPGFGQGAIIMDSRTYVPIRYVAEYIGANVEWIVATQLFFFVYRLCYTIII